jgi:hypothetical protein
MMPRVPWTGRAGDDARLEAEQVALGVARIHGVSRA